MNSSFTFDRNRSLLDASTALFAAAFVAASMATAQTTPSTQPSLLTSRAELTAAAERAEVGHNSRDALTAAAIRQRLREGDFQPGDRIVLRVFTDIMRSDTLLVRSGRLIDLPGKTTMSLEGVLRSEVKDKITTEVLRYVKARQVEVTPLTRVAVLGEVARPGYFALPSDVPVSEAIMAAGGPTSTADIERSVVRRAQEEIRSSDEIRSALSRGMTLDQFGLNAGDEIVVGKKRDFLNSSLMPIVGAVASLMAVFVAVHH